MNTSIQILSQDTTSWQQYFSIPDAVNSVNDHIDSLPCADTPEQHTRKVYTFGLKYFIEWLAGRLPTADLIRQFIADLKRAGRKSSTINCRYIAPARIFLRNLAGQHIDLATLQSPSEWIYINDAREHIRAALAVPMPHKNETSNDAPLDQTGRWLNINEVNAMYQSIDWDTIIGKRDLAIIYLGFTSALRLAEIQRITLSHIQPGPDCMVLKRLRGKRNNYGDVAIDSDAIRLIKVYVDAFNEKLDPMDMRYITDDVPIFQPLTRGSNCYEIGRKLGKGSYEGSAAGLSTRSIAYRVKVISKQALGFSISPHDMRRTVAAIARAEGMPYDDIRQLLRHKSIATTEKYVGKQQKLSKSLITNRISFDLGKAAS